MSRLNPILSVIIISVAFLTGCASLKKTTTINHADQNNVSAIHFIDDIHTQPGKKSTQHYTSKVNINDNQPDINPASIQEKYAQILGVPENDISNVKLYRFINDWWGVPYHYGGDSKQGIDCSAFVQTLYNDVYGINLARTSWELFHMVSFIRNKHHLQEGDLVFFRTTRSRKVTHVGVYLQNNKFVEASTSSGVTISDLNDPYWQTHYAGAGRVKK